MSRPVRFNTTPILATTADAVGAVEAPPGFTGEGFFTTQLSSVVGLARKNSIWPLPFATSCCGMSLWQPWDRITTFLVLVRSVWDFRHANVTF